MRVPVDGVELRGEWTSPPGASGVVLAARGCEGHKCTTSGRLADALTRAGLATLTLDLLRPREVAYHAQSAEPHFHLTFLASRLASATEWLRDDPRTSGLAVGYFGANMTGTAALLAAAERAELAGAVVTASGRPDLIRGVLPWVRCPTLLIVGGPQDPCLDWNREALASLRAEKRLEIVPDATPLFEDARAVEAAAGLAATWFSKHLSPAKAFAP